MGTYLYHLDCVLYTDPRYLTGVSNTLELSLPCMTCQRNDHTIVFEAIEKEGICTPKEKCSGFPGRVIERKIDWLYDRLQIRYSIRFEYEAFKEVQSGKKSALAKDGWARICVSIKCADCGHEELYSIQESAVRPQAYQCTCGKTLLTEKESPFRYSVDQLIPYK